MVIRFVLLCVVLSMAVGCGKPRGADHEAAVWPASLDLEIAIDSSIVERGTFATVRAFIVNRGRDELLVPLLADGSLHGWRSPKATWRSDIALAPLGMRCGNMNPLTESDLAILAPGERRELGWVVLPEFASTGDHHLVLEYNHDPALQWGGLPSQGHDRSAMRALQSIPAFRLTSNPIVVRVKDR